MENITESLLPSWIVKTTVKTTVKIVRKKSAEVRCYFNEKTWQTFHTRKDLNRYVRYVKNFKKEIPEVYADWTTDNKKKGVNKRRSKKKEVAGTSKGIRKNKKRAKLESDTAPDAPAKEQQVENGHKAVIVYTRRRKMAVAEEIDIPVSSPPRAEPKDHVFYESMDFYQVSEVGVGDLNGAL